MSAFGICWYLHFFLTNHEKNNKRTRSSTSSCCSICSAYAITISYTNKFVRADFVHNEIIKKNNITKEVVPYTGNICKACGFKAKSNAGLITHIKAMLNRKCAVKTIHSKYYK